MGIYIHHDRDGWIKQECCFYNNLCSIDHVYHSHDSIDLFFVCFHNNIFYVLLLRIVSIKGTIQMIRYCSSNFKNAVHSVYYNE